MTKFLSFEDEEQWKASDDYDNRFEYFRGGEYGCVFLYRDEKNRRGYWIKDDQFISAPLKKYGTPDLEKTVILKQLIKGKN